MVDPAVLPAVLDALPQTRPGRAAELQRPHAEEALLVAVLTDLLTADALAALPPALGLTGWPTRLSLWGHDLATGAEDPRLAAVLTEVLPGAGRAIRAEVEPDLIVETDLEVGCVDVALGRPGHAAARAARGEPVPERRVAEVAAALGATIPTDEVTATFPVARAAAVARQLGVRLDRSPAVVALAARSGDLLRPDRDPVASWRALADRVGSALDGQVALRAMPWLSLAEALGRDPAAERAARRIRTHPLLAGPLR